MFENLEQEWLYRYILAVIQSKLEAMVNPLVIMGSFVLLCSPVNMTVLPILLFLFAIYMCL